MNAPNPEVELIGSELVRCKPCRKTFKIDPYLNNLERHFGLAVHERSRLLKRQFSDSKRVDNCEFDVSATIALVSNDVPFYKIFGLSPFLETFMGRPIPDQNKLRRLLPSIAQSMFQAIASQIHGKDIWLSFDETSDDSMGKIVCFVVGTLVPNNSGLQREFLLDCAKVGEWKTADVLRVFDQAIRKLWPGNLLAQNAHRLKLLVTDRGSQMVAAANSILARNQFPEKKVVTCFCHRLNNLCDSFRQQYPNASEFATVVRNLFYIFTNLHDRKGQWEVVCRVIST